MRKSLITLVPLLVLAPACGDNGADDDTGDDTTDQPLDPDTAPKVAIDRFSAAAGTLMVRSGGNLPEADAPIDFDQAPFITRGLGPDGESVRYYNFDVRPTEPAPIYVLFHANAQAPVESQLNIIDVIPGDAGYNDFWQPIRVSVPDDYVANTVTSAAEIEARGFETAPMPVLVNCPVVPAGSTARVRLGGGDAGLSRGWYRDQVVSYFNFDEAALAPTTDGLVPTADIFVTFNVNPGEVGGGPPSGFVDDGTDQTHNVIASVPGVDGYSPLWAVQIYDNADFEAVGDLASAAAATALVSDAALVNCPLVERAEP